MPGFEEATRVEGNRAGLHKAGLHRARLYSDWEIWGPNGGYLAAIALRAAGANAPEGHRPATFSCQYLFSPPSTDVELRVDPARVGRSAACFNIALVHDGKVALQAQVWTTNRDAGPEHQDIQAPEVAPPHELKSMREHLPPGSSIHPFWEHFEARPTHFWQPDERDPRGAVMEAWYRHRDPGAPCDPFMDAARAMILIDTVPWPTFSLSQIPRPTFIAPSLDLTVWFHDRPAAEGWMLVEGQAPHSRAGLIHGAARVWSEDGRLLASGGSQLLVVERRPQ